MYEKVRTVSLPESVAAQPKNLQVVSFDADWSEIYMGASRRDRFAAVCPNNVPEAGTVSVKYSVSGERDHAVITCSKWCPMENCTLLVLGSQYGVQFHDWDGRRLIFQYDFQEWGVPGDEAQVTGHMARGIAALGSSYIAVGLHTGEILLIRVELDGGNYLCSALGRFRNHVAPITDLASSNTNTGKVLASGDGQGVITLWSLDEQDGEGALQPQVRLEDWAGSPLTALCIWNKYRDGVLITGSGSGHLRFFSLPSGRLLAEVTAHNGWITGMDLASQSGLLLTCGEDGYARVWQLNTRGPLVEHWFGRPVEDCLLAGAKFLDPGGASFCLCSYDSPDIQVFAM